MKSNYQVGVLVDWEQSRPPYWRVERTYKDSSLEFAKNQMQNHMKLNGGGIYRLYDLTSGMTIEQIEYNVKVGFITIFVNG